MKKILMTAMAVSLFALSAEAQYYGNQGYGNQGYNQGYAQPRSGYQNQGRNQATSQKRTSQRRETVKAKSDLKYSIGNPLYHPRPGQVILTTGASYNWQPKEDVVLQDKMDMWTIDPSIEVGVTDKLSVFADGSYAKEKVKSGLLKGVEWDTYDARIGLRYLLASADGFDFNVKAGLYYTKDRVDPAMYGTNYGVRQTGTSLELQVGKKIQNVTPYFSVGFETDLWSKRDYASGTTTYINPGVYINLGRYVGLDLNYLSEPDGGYATYSAMLDFYATDNVMLRIGWDVEHPDTDRDSYGVAAAVKVAF